MLVSGMTINLDRATGIVTATGVNEEKTYGDETFGAKVKMTVAGSGTSAVTITYVITAFLTGGVRDANFSPNPMTVTCVYTGTLIQN